MIILERKRNKCQNKKVFTNEKTKKADTPGMRMPIIVLNNIMCLGAIEQQNIAHRK
jgi:hypothetical protein